VSTFNHEDIFLNNRGLIVADKFRAYDYKEDNNLIYGQDTPPDYDLGKVTAPVALYWSDNDLLAHPTVI